MKLMIAALVAMCALLSPAMGEDQPAKSGVILQDAFDREELGSGWHANTGDWKIAEGVLRGREVPADKHSAALRRAVPTQNAVYELKFRFINEAKGFHFGFDPAPGQLKKKGHLFSVIVMPSSWKLMKHVDKARPKEDPNQTLAEQKTKFETGQWYTLKVTALGDTVTAHIDGKETFNVSHPTFGVKKPTLVFRCLGDGVEVDDIRVFAHPGK